MKWYVTGATWLAVSFSLTPVAWGFSTDNEARQAINELRQQVRVLTDTTQRVNIQMSERIDMLELEISRLRAMTEELGGRSAGSTGAATPGGSERAGNMQEQDAFDGAIDLYRQGDLTGAIESLKAFLTLYPNSALAPTAMFYMGSSQYANKNYREAITTLRNEVKRYPEHARSSDALLVVAASQYELNDRAGAKASLQEIIKNYSGSEAAKTAEQRIKLF